MDIRDKIIQSVTAALQAQGQQDDVIAAVQDILIIQLQDYEIQERCTAVTTVDTSAEVNLEVIRFLGKPLYEVTTYDLRFYLSVRRQQGRVSNRTLDGMRRCINGFFGWLPAEGLIGCNPSAALKQIKYRKVVKKPYTAVELERMRNACQNIRDLALVEFLYATACRVSEVSRLDIVDVDFENLECTVLGKGNKERMVYLTEVAAMYLQKYLDARKDTSNALFVGRGTRRIGKNGIEAIVKRLGKAAGVKNAHPHRYRRTRATNLLDRGMNIQDVAAILGHADLKTTQIYCFISQCNVKAAYQKFAA